MISRLSTGVGLLLTISGEARGHKVYFKKIKREEGLEGHDYEAEIDGYDAIEGDVARKLFEKYYDLAKYKTRI